MLRCALFLACLFVTSLAGAARDERIKVSIEEPANGASYSGISNLRGWAVSPEGVGEYLLEVFIDGEFAFNLVPYGKRIDVGNAFPDYPNSDTGGFSMAYNYKDLAPGEHEVKVVVYDNAGNHNSATSVFRTERFNSSFIAQDAEIDLSTTDNIYLYDDQTYLVSGATLEGEKWDFILTWDRASQSFKTEGIAPSTGNAYAYEKGSTSAGSGAAGSGAEGSGSPSDLLTGSATDHAGSVTSPIVRPDDATLVRETATIFAPSDYYQHACESPVYQFVLPVSLNDDSHADFIVHYWCAVWMTGGAQGDIVYEPTPDALVALESDGTGGWIVVNEKVFGQPTIGLGGVSRKVAREDINNDGFDDFAFAMNWEDGRAAGGELNETNETKQTVLLSRPNRMYEVVRLGEPNWGHAAGFIRNADGTTDAVFGGFTDGLHAFRFADGEFTEIYGAYPTQNSWAQGFIDVRQDNISQFIATTASTFSDGSIEKTSVLLYERDGAGAWLAGNGAFELVRDFQIDFVSWQGTEGKNSVFTLNGQQVISTGFDAWCVMPALDGSGNDLVVAKVSHSYLEEGFVEGELYSQLEEDRPSNAQLFVFLNLENGTLSLIESPLVDEDKIWTGNLFDCKDTNGDGLSDLVAYAQTSAFFDERADKGGKPILYLNDGKGNLIPRDLSSIPGHPGNQSLTSNFWDVDGDGIQDLILHGTEAGNGSENIIIRYLSRPL